MSTSFSLILIHYNIISLSSFCLSLMVSSIPPRWCRCKLRGDWTALHRDGVVLLHCGSCHGGTHARWPGRWRLPGTSIQGHRCVHQVHRKHLCGSAVLSSVCAANRWSTTFRHWSIKAPRASLRLTLPHCGVLCGASFTLHQQGAQSEHPAETHQLCLKGGNSFNF